MEHYRLNYHPPFLSWCPSTLELSKDIDVRLCHSTPSDHPLAEKKKEISLFFPLDPSHPYVRHLDRQSAGRRSATSGDAKNESRSLKLSRIGGFALRKKKRSFSRI